MLLFFTFTLILPIFFPWKCCLLIHLLHIFNYTPICFQYGSKHYEPWSDCSPCSSLIRVHIVCKIGQSISADDIGHGLQKKGFKHIFTATMGNEYIQQMSHEELKSPPKKVRPDDNRKCLDKFRENQWNQTTYVHRESNLITWFLWRQCHVNTITSVIAAKQTA